MTWLDGEFGYNTCGMREREREREREKEVVRVGAHERGRFAYPARKSRLCAPHPAREERRTGQGAAHSRAPLATTYELEGQTYFSLFFARLCVRSSLLTISLVR